MIKNKKITVIHEQKDGCYPINYLNEFKIGIIGDLKNNETITGCLSETSFIIPDSMKKISNSDIAKLLNSAIEAGLVFADIRMGIYKLMEYGCWVRLEGLVSPRIIYLLNSGIEIARSTEIEDDHRSYENPYKEIGLLGELATFERNQIAAIPGIGKKTMKIFDDLIKKNRLYWGFNMDLLRDLGVLT